MIQPLETIVGKIADYLRAKGAGIGEPPEFILVDFTNAAVTIQEQSSLERFQVPISSGTSSV